MLIKLKTLVVENDGYRRTAAPKEVYLNSTNIISISDHPRIEQYLLSEGLGHSSDRFCLIKVSLGNSLEELIAFGTSASIYKQINENNTSKGVLNG